MDAAFSRPAPGRFMKDVLTPSQQQAIAARGNVLVVAGAGTGKTSTLVQRCMKLLAEGASLENILMVTFTEAAAVEMRGRIRDAILARLDASSDGGSETLLHFQRQIALLDSAWICTLHSFCLQLVREHFDEIGIDPDVAILDEQQARPLSQQILDAQFEAHYAGSDPASLQVQRLVRIQGRGSDERIRTLVLKLHRYALSLAQPGLWFAQQRTAFESSQPLQWREWFKQGFMEWRQWWLPVLSDFSATPAVAMAVNSLEELPVQPQLTEVGSTLRTIIAADENDENWPLGSKKEVRSQLKQFFTEAEFLASLSPVDGTDALGEDWELVRHDMHTLLELAEEFGVKFSEAKRDMGGIDFADLEQFALRILRDADGQPSPAAQEWRRRLSHVFVDEYQDINAAQDSILSALSREGADANRFLVGDVKQSIYRFRLADPSIFRRYERLWSAETGSWRISLAENFRSRKGILQFVNEWCSALMRDEVGGVSYEPLVFGGPDARGVLASSESGPRVELHLITRSDGSNGESAESPEAGEVADLLGTEREARLVGLRLRALHQAQHAVWDKVQGQFRAVRWSDIAVLLRSPRSRVEAFAKEFAALGIPLEAARGGFLESTEVSDVVALLKLLDNPLQDIPLLAVLHSPFVGMSVSELAEIRAAEQPENRAKYFWQAARHFLESADRTCTAWQKLDRFLQQLSGWRELIRQSSLSHCIETALADTHYELLLRAAPRGEQQAANVRRLLDLAREYDPFQRQGLFRFLRFLAAQEDDPMELEPGAVSLDAVQLTSIHRSKGLEFPVVVLACMGSRFNERDLNESIILDDRYGVCAKVAPPDSDQRYPSLPQWLARRRQRVELLGEELRLLYVALTRARDTILLVGSESRKGNGRWESEELSALSDQEIVCARSCLDWLRLWLPHVTRDGDWTDEHAGRNALLTWSLYDECDPRFVLAPPDSAKPPDAQSEQVFHGLDPRVHERLTWNYPHAAAASQLAKNSVTELRRGAADDDSAAVPYARPRSFQFPAQKARRLSATDTGNAHHLFLQRVSLAAGAAEKNLRNEAKRLKDSGWLTAEQAAALDFSGLAAFWQSGYGREIAMHSAEVHRELAFTARLNPTDLASLGLAAGSALDPQEFIVVQGVADLVVIRPNELWIVDFKTDAVTELEIPAKLRAYQPQLRLYGLALSRIYARPVTRCALYFLATRDLVNVPLPPVSV
ncbi:MAG TPA: UvrD-helicase domain-containing protein [Verrucomicrobiae bacterium]|nr:UvrD-helicase domain-containing protein [Verrucomicrobiae bacterium]